MERILGRYSPYIYAILRIVAGFLFVVHGTQKLFGVPAPKQPMPLDALMTVAGGIELVAGLMVILGFFTSIAAFIASGLMAAAYFMAHQPMGALPIQNMGELAVILCFVFLYLASRGSGVWSVDSMLHGTPPQAAEPL